MEPIAIEYMNRETGEALTWEEMLKQAAEEYDCSDPTNCVALGEYYVGAKYVNGRWEYFEIY